MITGERVVTDEDRRIWPVLLAIDDLLQAIRDAKEEPRPVEVPDDEDLPF